jgi:hypothetical protein
VTGLACDFIYTTFFVLWFLVLHCGFYELLQGCSNFEHYSYVCASKQIGNLPYLGTMVSESGPDFFIVFLSVVYVISFVLYLSVDFLK